MSDFLEVAMYFDQATAAKYFNGASLGGIDNSHFDDSAVPFAPTSQGEQIALKKFARAYRAEHVMGPPVLLLNIKIPARFALEHFVAQEIKVVANRPEKTVGFMLPVNASNYPHMSVEVTIFDVEGVPEELLKAGLQLFY